MFFSHHQEYLFGINECVKDVDTLGIRQIKDVYIEE